MPLAFLFFLAGLHSNAFTAKDCWADVIWKYLKTNYLVLRWENVKLHSEQARLALWNQRWPYQATFSYFSLDCWRWEQQKWAPSEQRQSKVISCFLPFLASFERFCAFLSLLNWISRASKVLKLSCGELRACRDPVFILIRNFNVHSSHWAAEFSSPCRLDVE